MRGPERPAPSFSRPGLTSRGYIHWSGRGRGPPRRCRRARRAAFLDRPRQRAQRTRASSRVRPGGVKRDLAAPGAPATAKLYNNHTFMQSSTGNVTGLAQVDRAGVEEQATGAAAGELRGPGSARRRAGVFPGRPTAQLGRRCASAHDRRGRAWAACGVADPRAGSCDERRSADRGAPRIAAAIAQRKRVAELAPGIGRQL
jgi:hypothetical protein